MLVGLVLSITDAYTCTSVLITKGASADGSNLITYAADSHGLFGELYYSPAGRHQAGEMLKINEWDTGKFLGYIPQASYTFQTVGNMNEHQLIITESTYGGRSELFDSTGVMDYGSLIYIALQRAQTAREAINVIVDLANTYGYYSSGESFSIADKEEVWIMELIGKGSKVVDGKNVNKGIVWVARRVPDGYICAHANQARITTFPLNDPENCLYAPDVISFAREMGYFKGEDKDFSFCDAYAPIDFGGMRFCESRAWSAFNILGEGNFTFMDENGVEVSRPANDYLDYAMGYDVAKRFPLFIKPSKKVTVKAVADVMRDHFEGTPMDMTTDIGAGGNALPYRWRPMGFEYNGKEYINERAIATQQTGFWLVGQSRSWLPDQIGGILWFGTDDAATSYLTPIYTSLKSIPECFEVGNGSMIEYSPSSSFWMNNRISNACYKMYDRMSVPVRAKIDEWEAAKLEEIKLIDEKALILFNAAQKNVMRGGRGGVSARRGGAVRDGSARRGQKKMKDQMFDPYSSVKEYLTEYSVGTAQDIFNQWVSLESFLLVKYMDGNIKAQNADGTFVNNGHTDRIPDNIEYGGYNEKWKEAVAKDNGEILESK